MITVAWYGLKVVICSGLLCSYYYLALRNKLFHQWNRFYLLACAAASLALPLVSIDVFQPASGGKSAVIKLLQTISGGDAVIFDYSRKAGPLWDTSHIVAGFYWLVTMILAAIFFIALYRIYLLKIRYPHCRMKNIRFFSTDAPGTPFSFFHSIFWNSAIDLHSRQGQQIFNHEIAHVHQHHSYDKIAMNVVLIFCWFNPFFWLTRKELNMIHEFIADRDALEDHDISAFAAMILNTVYPGQQFSITNHFFHSPLKRRFIMFTKNKNPKVSYASRLFVLPLAALVFFAFTLKMKTAPILSPYTGKKITVVIDAGHGGTDHGAMANNVNEKDLNLVIAKDILALNKNKDITILLSRDNDADVPLQERTTFAAEKRADIFISIHLDAESNKNVHSGLSVFIPKNDNPYLKQSQLLGSSIIESFAGNYSLPVESSLQQQGSIWVLKGNACPAVLLEAGYLTTEKDFHFLNDPQNQKIIAQNVLNGIVKYAGGEAISQDTSVPKPNSNVLVSSRDTLSLPNASLYVIDGKLVSRRDVIGLDPAAIQSVNVLKGETAVSKYGEKGRDGVIEIARKIPSKNDRQALNRQPLYIIDGKESPANSLSQISPADIESINVLKDERSTQKYGDRGKNGVIEIQLKANPVILKDTLKALPSH